MADGRFSDTHSLRLSRHGRWEGIDHLFALRVHPRCICRGDYRMTTARFESDLNIRVIGNRSWMLLDDLIFYSEEYRGRFVAPAGFQTDLASIPRVVWSIFPKVGLWDKASVIHDAGYANALTTYHENPYARRRIFTTKHVADTLFREGMEAEKVNRLGCWFMHRAVVAFGSPDGHPLAANRETATAVIPVGTA